MTNDSSLTDVFEMPRRRFSRETLFIGAATFVIATILRVISLGRRDLYGDEYFGLDYILQSRPNFLQELFRGHMPLYYEILRGWGRLVGTASDALLRTPSMFFSLLAFVAFFFFAVRFLRGLAFVLCLVGFALNPTLVRSANEVSSYALLSLLVVGIHYFGIRALDEDRSKHWIRWAVTAGLGLLTHPLFVLVLLAQFIFALMRPHKTPRKFVVVASAGTLLIVGLMLIAVIVAKQSIPDFQPSTPSAADLARGVVAATVGEFYRYAGGERVFIRTVLYLFVLASLLLSWVYYQIRKAEAQALPEDVVWIDETQDVVGRWTRLSLASFLLYLWVSFLVPALGIMIIGGFASGVSLPPQFFIVTLVPLLVLIACGIDGAPGRAGSVILGLLFVFVMMAYNFYQLSDPGYGIKVAVKRTMRAEFAPPADMFLVVTPGGLGRPLARYMTNISHEVVDPPRTPEKCDALLQQKTEGRDRVFVLYHNDFRRLGKADRSLVREWFGLRKDKWETDKKWILCEPEKTELRIYARIDPTKTPPQID